VVPCPAQWRSAAAEGALQHLSLRLQRWFCPWHAGVAAAVPPQGTHGSAWRCGEPLIRRHSRPVTRRRTPWLAEGACPRRRDLSSWCNPRPRARSGRAVSAVFVRAGAAQRPLPHFSRNTFTLHMHERCQMCWRPAPKQTTRDDRADASFRSAGRPRATSARRRRCFGSKERQLRSAQSKANRGIQGRWNN